MKSACRAAAFCVALAGATPLARADDGQPVTLAPEAPAAMQATPQVAPHFSPSSSSDLGTSSTLDDGTEAALEQSAAEHEEFLRQSAAKAYDTEAQKQAYDNDWMLRGYTAELNTQGIGTAAERDAAATQEVPDPSAPRNADASMLPPLAETTAPPPDRRPANPDASEISSASDAPAPLFLPPLLAGGEVQEKSITRLDAWGSTTTAATIAAPNLTPTLLPSEKTPDSPSTDTESSLDVPGLTAERQDLGAAGDLNVPDQQMETATENADNRARKDDFLLPTAPSNDSSEFFKRQSEALAAPNSPLALHPTTGNILLGPPPAPPVVRAPMPPPTGIRSHVADPFDLIGGHRD